ncbi:MAG TPA: ABC transporter permease [Magnetospirillaceae bacterium]|jgi:putative spermidine/putrescine transport system permease protein
MRTLGRVVLGLIYLFLIGPFLVIIAAAFHGGDTLTFPPHNLSFRWIIAVIENDDFQSDFLLSVALAVAATFAALALGIPAAYALIRHRPRGAETIRGLLSSPVVVSGLVIGLALLHYVVVPLNLPVMVALFVAHTAILLPYAVRVVSASLANLRVDIEEAAVLLGASRLKMFRSIVLPNIRNGVLAAAILSFITSFNEVPASLFLTGPGVHTLPVEMMLSMELVYDPSIAALSTLLTVATLVIVFAAERLLGLSRYV